MIRFFKNFFNIAGCFLSVLEEQKVSLLRRISRQAQHRNGRQRWTTHYQKGCLNFHLVCISFTLIKPLESQSINKNNENQVTLNLKFRFNKKATEFYFYSVAFLESLNFIERETTLDHSLSKRLPKLPLSMH